MNRKTKMAFCHNVRQSHFVVTFLYQKTYVLRNGFWLKFGSLKMSKQSHFWQSGNRPYFDKLSMTDFTGKVPYPP
ncbi:MAG: hypothetical protein DWP97_12435 [Calditrichaeota bacterium]|nr:MAG: hypothetical protein DWP97_12435 [Calditrichota bacterium]